MRPNGPSVLGQETRCVLQKCGWISHALEDVVADDAVNAPVRHVHPSRQIRAFESHIFGLEALATPGHTAGHMAVIDHSVGLLVAGDAIFTDAGGAIEGPAQFFNDVPKSRESIRQMSQLSFNTLLVGHGEPIEGAADTAVAQLAAGF